MIHVAREALRQELVRNRPRPRYVASHKQRLRLILWGYYSGCRVSEIASLRYCDITERKDGDFNVSVLGKGKRRRSVPMPAWVVAEVRSHNRRATKSSLSRLEGFRKSLRSSRWIPGSRKGSVRTI